jgi:hypothetical protein
MNGEEMNIAIVWQIELNPFSLCYTTYLTHSWIETKLECKTEGRLNVDLL